MTWDQEITNKSLSQNEGWNIQAQGAKGLYLCPGKWQLCGSQDKSLRPQTPLRSGRRHKGPQWIPAPGPHP